MPSRPIERGRPGPGLLEPSGTIRDASTPTFARVAEAARVAAACFPLDVAAFGALPAGVSAASVASHATASALARAATAATDAVGELCAPPYGVTFETLDSAIADWEQLGADLYEIDREKLDDGLLGGVSFSAADACAMKEFDYSHVYIFDRVFSGVTLRALAKVLQRSPFYIMLSSRKPQVWWGVGLSKIQPVAKLRRNGP